MNQAVTAHVDVPPSLVREQLPAITGMTTGLLMSLTPAPVKNRLIDQGRERHMTVAPASDRLVDHYVAWCGAPAARYEGTLPPHFFAKYGMSLVARLTGQVPYNMMNVLNQGCRFQVRELIPRGEEIRLRGRLLDCSEDGPRVRVHTQVTAGWSGNPDAMTVDSFAAVMLGKPGKKRAPKRDEPEFSTVGSWSADRHEGQRFFYLTGDFNPIHTFWPLAKRTRFGGCILHGFGSLARSWEAIRNAGYEIADADLRFVKPNLLPNPRLDVQVAVAPDRDGYRQARLVGGDGSVYLAGRFRSAEQGA